MNNKILSSLLILAVFLGAVQVAEPVAAGTLLDSGKWTFYEDGQKVTSYYKAWKTDNNYVNAKISTYMYGMQIASFRIWIKKTSSTNVKITMKFYSFGSTDWSGDSKYYTKSAVSYWYNKAKPEFEDGLN